MSDIFQTVSRMNDTTNNVIHCQKSKTDLDLKCSSKSSELFSSVKLDLSKVVLLSAGHTADDGPLVIDANVDKLRKTASGYTPKIIVISGMDRLRSLKASKEEVVCDVWVGHKAFKTLSLKAADAVGNSELADKIQKVLSSTYSVSSKTDRYSDSMSYMKSPWIVEVYPFDNYVIYSLGGDKYKHTFTFDTKTRVLVLTGKPMKVHQEYVPDDVQAGAVNVLMSDNDVMVDYGSINSELNNPMMTMTNVEEALAAYRIEVALSQHIPMYASSKKIGPANALAAKEAAIAASEANLKDFSVADFLKWQDTKMRISAAEQTRICMGETLFASDYAYVGDKKDISTWHLPMHTITAAQYSLRCFPAEVGIPVSVRASIKEKLSIACGKEKTKTRLGKMLKRRGQGV